jgi:hypothetical protein
VTYQIINVGNAAATGIEVVDRYDATRLAAAESPCLFLGLLCTIMLLFSFESKNNVNEEGNVGFELEELVPGE